MTRKKQISKKKKNPPKIISDKIGEMPKLETCGIKSGYLMLFNIIFNV